MKKIIIVGIVMALSCVARASDSGDRYWVVGSFSTVKAAQIEQERLSGSLNDEVRIARFELPGGELFRLMVPQGMDAQDQKLSLQGAGLSPWSVSVSGSQVDFVDVSNEKLQFHLVLGSFSDAGHAQALADKLAGTGLSGIAVKESMAGGQTRYRVMAGPYDHEDADARSMASDAGISDAWWFASMAKVDQGMAASRADAGTAESAQPASQQDAEPQAAPAEPESMADADTEADTEEPAAQPLSPPQPGESYFDYCVKRANARERARYCGNGEFSSAVREKQVRDGAGGQAYVDFCAKEANAEQRERFCKDATFGQRMTPAQ